MTRALESPVVSSQVCLPQIFDLSCNLFVTVFRLPRLLWLPWMTLRRSLMNLGAVSDLPVPLDQFAIAKRSIEISFCVVLLVNAQILSNAPLHAIRPQAHRKIFITWRQGFGSKCYNGMLPCFFHGVCCCLSASTSSSSQSRCLVVLG